MDSILLDRYQILQSLNSGGFGETFLAIDLQSANQKKVVLKSLKSNHHEITPEISEKLFLKEASVLEELGSNCTQIPSLYAYISQENKYYLVQEYIEGKNLLELGIITSSQCISILSSLLDTLEYIHKKNIIHRDIKPENIIIRQSDRLPVLIDFGAVKETMGSLNTSISSTVPSIVIGTQCFMAPEQSSDRTVFSSDLYALGLSMIYSLTGKLPQEFSSDPITGELEWQDNLEVDLDNNLQKVLTKATQMDIASRYPTAEAMSKDLHFKTSHNVASLYTNNSETFFAQTQENNSPQSLVSTKVATNNNNTTSSVDKDSLEQKKTILIVGLFLTVATLLTYIFVSSNQNNEYQSKLAQIEQQKAEIQAQLAQQLQISEENQTKSQKAEQLRIDVEKKWRREEQLRKQAQKEVKKLRLINSIIGEPENPDKKITGVVGGTPGRKNIRSGPGTNNQIIGRAYTGDTLQIIGGGEKVGNYIWYQIYHPQSNTKGWMASQLVDF